MAAILAGKVLLRYFDDLMNLLKINKELEKTASGIFKQVALGVAGITFGGFIGGPVGAMLGGFAGCIVGYIWSSDYKTLIKALQDMSDEEKKEIVQQVQQLVKSSSFDALKMFIETKDRRSALINLLRKAT